MKLLVIPPRSKWERAVAEALRVLESFCFSGFSLQALLTERCPGLLFFFPIAFVLLIAFLLLLFFLFSLPCLRALHRLYFP